jgi:hypothetical protein
VVEIDRANRKGDGDQSMTETTTLKPTLEELDMYSFLRQPTQYFISIVERSVDLSEEKEHKDLLDFQAWLDAHDFESRVALWIDYMPYRKRLPTPKWWHFLYNVFLQWTNENCGKVDGRRMTTAMVIRGYFEHGIA